MSDEPTFDFKPWEELSVGVRRNRKKMYEYMVSVLNGGGPTPPGPTPTGTGTVTVTCQDEWENPLEDAQVMLTTTAQITDPQTQMICAGSADVNGTVTLKELDWTLDPPFTDVDKQVPYGDYYVIANYPSLHYTGTLTVDGDETVTITLTE